MQNCYPANLLDVVDTLSVDTPEPVKFTANHRSAFARERYEQELLMAFQSGWFEVTICSPRTTEDYPSFLAPDQVIESFPVGYPTWRRNRSRSFRRNTAHLHTDNGLYLFNIRCALYLFVYNYYMFIRDLSEERLRAKLRVTKNRCVIFNFPTDVHLFI